MRVSLPRICDRGGFLILTTRNRFGYSGLFLERQRVEQILYDCIEDKSPLRTSKRVVSIENYKDSAIVVAADGTSMSCDFVAGADGVRSLVRREIERKSLRSATHGGMLTKFPMYTESANNRG